MRLSKQVAVAFFILLPLCLPAAAPRLELTVDNIMRGPGLVGYEPRELRWSGDGQRLYFSWKQASDPLLADFDTYVVQRDGTGLHKLSDDEARLAPPSSGDLSRDKSKVAYVREGDLYLYDFAADRGRRLTKTGDVEGSARFLRDGRRVSFVRASNLYVLSLEDGLLERLTNVRPPASPAPGGAPARPDPLAEEKKGTDSQEYIKREEKELFDVVRQRAQQKDTEKQRKLRDNPRKPYMLAPRQSIGAMELTPDEKYIIAAVTERSERATRTSVPNYLTETGYSETMPSRTKVGDVQERTRLAVISMATGELKWVDHGMTEVATPKTESKSAEKGEDKQEKEAEPKPREREMTCSLPLWSEDGARAVVVGRAADNKDAWIMALDPATAKTRPITALHDDAWVGGPGTSGFGFGSGLMGFTLGWMKDDHTIYFQSERTGYSHLYTVPFEGGEPRALTSGNWEVLRARLAQDKSRFYLETREADAGQRHLYVMDAGGGERVRLTAAAGMHETTLSRDEKYFADLYSYTTKPTEIYVQDNRTGAEQRRLTTSPAPEFSSYPWIDPQTVFIPARDGAKVPGHLFKPASGKRGGPAVIFVHGAGYLQNVHRGWSRNYYREFMFHNLLASRGYTVLQLDYRGSAGYGRDWRTAIYRHMGGKDLDDQVDAARWLAKEHGVDPKRIGIYGGSYGGFLTLMAMFTQPDVFAAGAAMRPVTDWAHYNHPYTSNILNTPQKDAEAYRLSSPIYYADRLKGALLICHGMVDTNVHFQDTVRLVQRLIELRKPNWEVAMYPVEDHSFVQAASWADEYRRILKLFEDNLRAGTRR